MKNLDSASSNTKNNLTAPPKIQSGAKNQPPAQVSLLKSTGGKKSHALFKGLFLLSLLITLILGTLVFSRASSLSNKIFAGHSTTFFGKVWEALRGASGKIALQGENQGQINILLMGIGGPGHEGPYLTDTMILAQVRPKTSEVTLVSVPRDLLAELPGNLGQRKINSVFAEGFARAKNFNEAGRWARMAVERVSGQTIPYFAVVDFEGFRKATDEIGGLDINVEREFTDYQFPDEKFGYLPPLNFKAGQQHMDGQRALEFARSRHAEGLEGSDFARSQRQQKIIKAFKEKILNMNFLTSLGRLNNLLNIFADNFHTNLNPGEIFRLYDMVREQNIQSLLSLSLDLETGILCPTLDETAGYILIPCPGKTASDVQNFFKNASVFGKLAEEKSLIWLGDSTANPAAYKTAEKKLVGANLKVWQLNYNTDNLPQTIIYQVNPKPATLAYIKNILKAKEISLPPPGVKVDSSKVDLIVILGQNNN